MGTSWNVRTGVLFQKKRHGKRKLILHIKKTVLWRTYGDYTKDYLCWSEERRFHEEKDTLQILFAPCSTQCNIKLTLQVQKMSTNIIYNRLIYALFSGLFRVCRCGGSVKVLQILFQVLLTSTRKVSFRIRK